MVATSPYSPSKFLVVHRIHIDRFFLARNHYTFHVLVNADERACLNVIVSAISHQVLDCLPCNGIQLDFVKDDYGLTFVQGRTLESFNVAKKKSMFEKLLKTPFSSSDAFEKSIMI